jgi:uncharacterized protein (DUF2141 family)
LRIKSIIFLLITTFLFSCAQIVPLTGGDQDITPPKEVECSPKNKSILFTEDEIEIEFDEFIKLQNLSSQLIISPLMKPKPEVMVKGKKLIIKLQDSLMANTTYSFNFGSAITDITEYNPSPNYKYVFSTGDYIDSLSYSGTVINAFDLTPKENVFILLYNQFEDSVPLKELPRYVAITDKEGKFSVTNVAAGKYKVFAIKDINNNYLFDLPNEEIGFRKEPLDLQKNSSGNVIAVFEEDKKLQYVVNSEMSQFGNINIILNNPTDSLIIRSIKYPNNESLFLKETNPTGDTISLWGIYKEDLAYPLTKVEQVKDWSHISVSDGNGFTDTLDLKSVRNMTDSISRLSFNTSGLLDLDKNIIITMNRPFKAFDNNLIKLYQDSLLVSPQPDLKNIGLRKFELDYNFEESHDYKLEILPSAFEDIFEKKNDTVILNFKTRKQSDYGNIALNLSPNFQDTYVLQLWKGGNLVQEDILSGKTQKTYSYLRPGKYEFKLIVDSNHDGKWTTGDYLGGEQPEKVLYYKKEINIRANWDNDISWIVKN